MVGAIVLAPYRTRWLRAPSGAHGRGRHCPNGRIAIARRKHASSMTARWSEPHRLLGSQAGYVRAVSGPDER